MLCLVELEKLCWEEGWGGEGHLARGLLVWAFRRGCLGLGWPESRAWDRTGDSWQQKWGSRKSEIEEKEEATVRACWWDRCCLQWAPWEVFSMPPRMNYLKGRRGEVIFSSLKPGLPLRTILASHPSSHPERAPWATKLTWSEKSSAQSDTEFGWKCPGSFSLSSTWLAQHSSSTGLRQHTAAVASPRAISPLHPSCPSQVEWLQQETSCPWTVFPRTPEIRLPASPSGAGATTALWHPVRPNHPFPQGLALSQGRGETGSPVSFLDYLCFPHKVKNLSLFTSQSIHAYTC